MRKGETIQAINNTQG